MLESAENRISRLEAASNCIIQHSPHASFNDLIEPNLHLFNDFRLIYSTNHLDADFKGILLSEIENICPAINKYFYGTGLCFYSDNFYKELKLKGSVALPIDYSISFDTQVAEAFRCYEDGKNISKWDWFESLVKTIKEKDFNFDYTFYIVEDLVNSFDITNNRPFNTIRALKRFDNLDFSAFKSNPKSPVFNDTRDSAGKSAIEALYSFGSSDFIKRSLIRRKGLKLIMMKAMQLRWVARKDFNKDLAELVEYSITVLGKFGKLELYSAWKLLKSGHLHDFFIEILQPSEKALKKINGISWDLYSLRHQETMASFSKIGDFYIPLIATFDKRFKSFIKAFPLRCLLIDDRDERLNLIFYDEKEFFNEINNVVSSRLRDELANPKAKVKRLSIPLDEPSLDDALLSLENECRMLIQSKNRV